MPWFERYIAHYAGVQGGAPVITETRTPVGTIVAYYETNGGAIGEVLCALPHLSETEVRAALAYYEQHRAEVDADEARHQQALTEFFRTTSPVAR